MLRRTPTILRLGAAGGVGVGVGVGGDSAEGGGGLESKRGVVELVVFRRIGFLNGAEEGGRRWDNPAHARRLIRYIMNRPMS